MRVKWEDKSSLEWLQILKNELERLGLSEDPSRTELHKVYDKDIMPSPNTYLNQLGLSWKEIMDLIGLDYQQYRKKGIARSGRPKVNYTKEDDDKALRELGECLRKFGIKTRPDYDRVRGDFKSSQWYILHFGSWLHAKSLAKDLLNEEEK